MKRYISSSGRSSSSNLVSAISYVLKSTMGMGDSLEDIVEGLAFADDSIELPDEYVANELLNSILTQLVDQRSADLVDFIRYEFVEYPDMMLMEISTSSPSGTNSKLYKAIKTIYSQMGEFPGGEELKEVIEENIFGSPITEGNAAEIGYLIGQLYWKYITRKEYGVRSNTASAVGVSIGCRDAIGGKYNYAFMQDISSYYYEDLYMHTPGMPADTGYMLKFYNEGNTVRADVFNLYTISSGKSGWSWVIGDEILHTFEISGSDDAAIDSVSHEIANWYDDHVEDAIAAAVDYVG